MLDETVLDLTFPKLPYGSHATPWDLSILLYRGGAGESRRIALERASAGHLGAIDSVRIPWVRKIHEVVTSGIERGLSPNTTASSLDNLWRFVEWMDANGHPLTEEHAIQGFLAWTDMLLQRVRVKKDLTMKAARAAARMVADVIARALNYPHSSPGAALVRTTSLRAPPRGKKILGPKANKQNLEDTFEFGGALAAVCDLLDAKIVRGPIPIWLTLKDGRRALLRAGLRLGAEPTESINDQYNKRRADERRQPLGDGVCPRDNQGRASLLNLRIEAEMLIFIAQTGMNLSQATVLRERTFRWQSDGEDLQAYRVYKGRRGGEAIFRCYRAYRQHLKRYLAWLRELGFPDDDGRLFPFTYPHAIPAVHSSPDFSAIQRVSKDLGIRPIRPRLLRNTRINWLLRRSRDLELTADQAAHTKQTLIRVYEQPHHQAAVAEIVRFHSTHDPAFAAPGPGSCGDRASLPMATPDRPPEAPLPDCISPDGCVFCIYHLDVMSVEYCWKLASHAKLKQLELSLHRPPRNASVHPAARVIDRLNAKLDAIAALDEAKALWVRNARDSVRAGRYHPDWRSQIELFEAMT